MGLGPDRGCDWGSFVCMHNTEFELAKGHSVRRAGNMLSAVLHEYQQGFVPWHYLCMPEALSSTCGGLCPNCLGVFQRSVMSWGGGTFGPCNISHRPMYKILSWWGCEVAHRGELGVGELVCNVFNLPYVS